MNLQHSNIKVFGAVALLMVSHAGFAAESSVPEKGKQVELLSKPSISKPKDVLVPQSTDAKAAPEGKQAAAGGAKSQGSVEQGTVSSGEAKQQAQTPAGRPIHDVRIESGAGQGRSVVRAASLKSDSGTVPASSRQESNSKQQLDQAATSSSTAGPTDPLEARVRSLIQDRLGKDGELVLRVSPDTAVVKTNPTTVSTPKSGTSAVIGDPTGAIKGGQESAPKVFEDPKLVSRGKSSGTDLWDWVGPRGAQAWGRLDPAFAACSSGVAQSPPSISEDLAISFDLPMMPRMQSGPQSFHWARQGPLWTAHLSGGSSIEFRGETFALESIQFRIPGEPFVGRKPHDASVHLIHRSGSRLLIIAIPIQASDRFPRNIAISTLVKRFPYDDSERLDWSGLTVDPSHFMSSRWNRALVFNGSLSYPPCTEGVVWILGYEPIKIPSKQIEEIEQLLGKGFRPLQPLNNRAVLGVRGSTH
jgi:carbonic anhydrase